MSTTPTPWRVSGAKPHRVYHPNDGTVRASDRIAEFEVVADAALAVRAVNAFDKLMSLARGVLATPEWRNAHALAREALALGGEGEVTP